MKLYCLAFLIVLQVSPLAKQNATKPTSHDTNTDCGQKPPPSSQVAPTVVGSQEHKEATKGNQLPPNDDHRWVRWGVYINGALAVATFILAVYAVKQANASQEGAAAARSNAEAAKASADALVNIERPWIIVSAIQRSSDTFTRRESPDEQIREMRVSVKWRFKNFGKTPAFITTVAGGINLVKGFTKRPRNYDMPYSFAPDPLLAPGQESEEMKFIGDAYGQEEIGQINRSELFVIFYGKIDYADPFGKTHFSHFSYFYDPHSATFKFRWGDPEEKDNEYT